MRPLAERVHLDRVGGTHHAPERAPGHWIGMRKEETAGLSMSHSAICQDGAIRSIWLGLYGTLKRAGIRPLQLHHWYDADRREPGQNV
ncbi:hypothetical protein D3C75_740670 [compost metagenome]